ncbi:MAG: tyrosine-type recombinase/integrase [Anaerolineae bacterium]|nr:tyrosine-type recombinase/integrase [Anaerolineae bacterium]
MLLSDAVEALLIATRADGRSPSTVNSYRRKLKPLVDFLGDVEIETITIDDLRGYVGDLMDRQARWASNPYVSEQAGGLSPFTVASHVRAIKRLFNWLQEEGHLDNNPARRLKVPQPRRMKPKAISRQDLTALLGTTEGDSVADIRDRALILFLADTGCRVGGLCGLELEDLDLDNRTAIVCEKGDKCRMVFFTEPTAEALRAWLEVRPDRATDCVFVTLSHSVGALTGNAVTQMLKRRAKQAGAKGPVNPHAFRHAFAREFLLGGGNLGTLSDILGHTDVEVTKMYYAVFTTGELKRQHDKYSPIAQMFGEKGGGNGHGDGS